MQKSFQAIALSLVFLFTTVASVLPSYASTIGFSMAPKLPANQRSETSSYFDLDVQPGQQQVLTVTIANKMDTEIAVLVEAYTASTNMNGEINYSEPTLLDDSLVYSFSDMVTIEESRIVIPANSEKDVNLTVQFPDKTFDGVILGAIRALKELTEEEKNADQMLINQFAYSIAVKAQQSETALPVEFALGDVVAELENYRAAIVCNVRNPQPIVVKGASVHARVYSRGQSDPMMELTKDSADFAPNSVFPFFLTDQAGYGLKPGQYQAKVDVVYEGQEWNFERDFEIKAEEAAEINQTAVNQTQQQTASGVAGLSTWGTVVMAVGALLLVFVAILLVVLIRKRR